MPLRMEVGLSPGDFVLDGDPAPTPKGAEPHPIFGPCLLWPRSPTSATAELLSHLAARIGPFVHSYHDKNC